MKRGSRKALRDIFQAVIAVLAAGGATAVADLVVDTVSPVFGVVLAFVFKILVAYAQNSLETSGRIPVMLPTPGLVVDSGRAVGSVLPRVTTSVSQTVGDTAKASTTLTGEVLDTAGQVVGTVGGTVGNLLGDVEDLGGTSH